MKLTKQWLREHGIYNSHDIAKRAGSRLYIDYYPQQLGRAYQSAKWQVIGMGFSTDPNAHWADYGNKTFDVFKREDKVSQLESAMSWCKDKFGITEWERDPFGGYQIKGTLELIK